jgi:hypothetical protein
MGRPTCALWEILTFFGQNSITFDREVRFLRDFFKMQVISVAFMVARSGFQEVVYEQLGMLKGAVIRNTLFFSKKSYRFFGISRARRLHLTCYVDLSSWRFFSGSIDSSKSLHLFD